MIKLLISPRMGRAPALFHTNPTVCRQLLRAASFSDYKAALELLLSNMKQTLTCRGHLGSVLTAVVKLGTESGWAAAAAQT